MFRRFCVLAAIVPLMSAGASSAPAGDSAAALHWRNIGPFRGGRSVAATGVPGRPAEFYFGSVGGGVWKTQNAGVTWAPVFDAAHVASVGAVAVAPSAPDVVYVGTGEADFRSDLQQGNGMWSSHDGGQTWRHIGLDGTRAIGRISVDPHDPNDLVVAALGHPYGPNAERGIFRSTDGGTTWKRTLFVNADTGAVTVARDPNAPGVLFAAMLQTRRPPWSVYPPSKGPGTGLYRSSDNGATWTPVRGGGLPQTGLGRIGIAVAPGRSSRVYAIVDATDGGLYRSDDGGATWRRTAADRRLWQRGWYFSEVAVDPRDPDTVYVSNTSVYRSHDGGVTFTAIKGAPGGDDYHQLWIAPDDPQRMILASDQGTVISVDGARTWSSWYNQPTAQIYHVATDNRYPFWVYGAQQDSGAIAVPSRSSHRGITRADWEPIEAGGESDEIAPDPLHPGVLFGSRVVREDLATHVTRNVSPTVGAPGTFRSTWTLPLVFSPLEPSVLYFSHQQLFRTADGGAHWTVISPDLTRENPQTPATLDAPTAADVPDGSDPRRGVIYTIAPSPLARGTIWAGTDDGNIALTRNEGAAWTSVTPAGLSAWSKIATLEASHFDARSAYAAIDRHRLDDNAPYIYRTHDGGATWRNVVAGIPAGSFVNVVREDPLVRGLLYAGTETGVYVSFDDGDRWQSLQRDLPTASVRDIAIRDGALVIATHGRGFWILDDLAFVRAMPAAAAAPLTVVTPDVAYRSVRDNDEGTPLPPETPAGENPPDGVRLEYVLHAPASVVTVEIMDALGRVVRSWSSAEPPAAVDPAQLEFPAHWAPAEQGVTTSPGAHTLVWDLHEAARVPRPAGAQADDLFAPRGVWANTGTYRVRLTADGHRVEHLLHVALDPRIAARPADLAAQNVFARAIEDLRMSVRTSIRRGGGGREYLQKLVNIDADLAALEDAEQSAPAAPTLDELHTFDRIRTEIADAAHAAGASTAAPR